MGRYGQIGGLGIVAPWGLRTASFGGFGSAQSTACETYQEARILAQRYGWHLPTPPAGCAAATGPVLTTTPTGAPQTAPHPVDTAPLATTSPDPYIPPPTTSSWFQSPLLWGGLVAVAAAWWAFK